MNNQIRISAKNLGSVALPDFCPRCHWIVLKCCFKLPYQIFPGIFSSIDSYSKKIVHSWLDRHNRLPEWLDGLKNVCGYISPPHHSKFNKVIEEHNILITGSPDAIFQKVDGSYLIADYKTARYTKTQDYLYPMYEAQLNAYGMIAKDYGLNPVSELALIYTEPVTDNDIANQDSVNTLHGFTMKFRANIHHVKVDVEILNPLFTETRRIYELENAPASRSGCKDCALLNQMVQLFE